jgi:hypothetical protein
MDRDLSKIHLTLEELESLKDDIKFRTTMVLSQKTLEKIVEDNYEMQKKTREILFELESKTLPRFDSRLTSLKVQVGVQWFILAGMVTCFLHFK